MCALAFAAAKLVIMLLNGLNCKKYSVAIVIHSEVLLANFI